MLPITNSAILTSKFRSDHSRLEAYFSGYGFADISDYLIGWSMSRGVDGQTRQLSISFARELNENIGFSPLIADTGPIVQLGRELRLSTATLGEGQLPESGDWNVIFYGYIVTIEWSKTPMVLTCLDSGGRLGQTFIETQQVYGSDAGAKDVEDVIQDLLDDHYNTSPGNPVTLYSVNGTGGTPFNASDSPGWKIKSYKQSKDHILPTVRKLAQQIGWECKYRWQQNVGSFELMMWAPDRAVAARGSLTMTTNPSAAETFTVNSTTFTARTSSPGTNEFLIGATKEETAANIVSMFKAGSEADNANAWAVGAVVTFEWVVAGTVGNGIVFTETMVNATADGGGYLGGTRAGAAGKTTPDFTFEADEYFNVNKINEDIKNIRNKIRVTYDDKVNGRTSVIVQDADSISTYGKAYMEVTERSGGQIDSGTEATGYAQAILNDLAYPEVDVEVTLPYFWPVEEGDLIRLKANGIHFDADQDLFVISIRDAHPGYDKPAVTLLQLRGKPSAGVKRWLQVQGMPGIAPPIDLYSDDQPSSIDTEPGVGSIDIVYDDPRTMSPPIDDWAYTECHISTSSGFTPTAATLYARDKVTRFSIGGLVPGETYYIKLVIIDNQGNESTISVQATATAEEVGPYHRNNEEDWAIANPNSTFGVQTKDVTYIEPDWWQAVTGQWGAANDFYYSTTYALSGDRSIFKKYVARPGSGTTLYDWDSYLFVVQEDKLYVMEFAFRHDGYGSSNRVGFVPRIMFYDKDKNYLSTATIVDTLQAYSVPGGTVLTANTWYLDRGWIVPPSTAVYAKVNFHFEIPSTWSESWMPTIYFDRMAVRRALVQMSTTLGGTNRVAAANTWVYPYFTLTPLLDTNTAFTPGVVGLSDHYYTVPYDSEYMVIVYVEFTAGTAGIGVGAAIEVNAAIVEINAHTYVGTGLDYVAAYVQTKLQLSAGDIVRAVARHDDSVARTIDASKTFMRVIQISNSGTQQ